MRDWLRHHDFLIIENSFSDPVRGFLDDFGARIIGVVGPGQPTQGERALQRMAGQAVTAEIDGFLLLTGLGVRRLASVWSRSIGVASTRNLFTDIGWLAGTPSVARELHEQGIDRQTLSLPECDGDAVTVGRRFLEAIDQVCRVEYLNLGVEKTVEFDLLRCGLEARGAKVWAMPTHGRGVRKVSGEENLASVARRYAMVFAEDELLWLLGAVSQEVVTPRTRLIVADSRIQWVAERMGFEVVACFDPAHLDGSKDALAKSLAPRLW